MKFLSEQHHICTKSSNVNFESNKNEYWGRIGIILGFSKLFVLNTTISNQIYAKLVPSNHRIPF